jgi:hypothetical protein
MQNERGQGVSHATDSKLPETVQSKVPASVEHKVPDSVHDTGANPQTGKVSHATGKSIVPQALQEGLPEKVCVEKMSGERTHANIDRSRRWFQTRFMTPRALLSLMDLLESRGD